MGGGCAENDKDPRGGSGSHRGGRFGHLSSSIAFCFRSTTGFGVTAKQKLEE